MLLSITQTVVGDARTGLQEGTGGLSDLKTRDSLNSSLEKLEFGECELRMCQELLLKKKKVVSDSKNKANRQRRAEKADSERQPFISQLL